VVTALAADEFKHTGVAAFQLALLEVGRLASQAGRIAVAQLASNRECDGTLVLDPRPRAAGIVLAARYAIRTISRANVGFGVRVCTSH
jgi:hypothetical protein